MTRLSYELEFQGLRLDVFSTIREEIRDQVFVIMGSLDNLMVVATLMLSLGFGFVVEGTFPPKTAEELGNWEISSIGFSVDPLVVYAFLCAMSLVCPFWCLIFTIRMRYEVDLIIREHMKELKRQLCNVIQKKEMQAPDESQQPVVREVSAPLNHVMGTRSAVCPKRLRRVLTACPQRRQEDIEEAVNAVANTVAKHVGPFSIAKEFSALRSFDQAQIVKWAEKDLMLRMTTYQFYMKAAHLLLWVGMLCAIFTCSILLGLYMMEQFPNTPLVWITYSHIVGLNGGLAIVFALWIWRSSLNPVVASTGRQSVDLKNERLKRSRSSSSMPLLENTSPSLFSCSPKTDSSRYSTGSKDSPFEQEQVAFRVRDGSSGLDAYRQVNFPVRPVDPRGPLEPAGDFAQLEKRICAKFQGRRGGKTSCLKSLVRLRDRLEIVDDEDVAQLCNGDELEAVFGLSSA
uniref:Uncharacterized protein n=1 Tax=Alexandrium monilatum TaxID=311494 RepID=A0A7S4R0T8_9DINO